MTQKNFGQLSEAIAVTSVVTQAPLKQTEATGVLGTRFTAFAMSFNVIGIFAVTFGNTAFSGNVLVADLVLVSSMVCLTASLFRSSLSRVKQKLGRFK
jgi:hypothetical protein